MKKRLKTAPFFAGFPLAISISACMASLFLVSCRRHDSKEVARLNRISYHYHYRSPDSVALYADSALRLSGKYSAGRAEALNNLAFVSIAKMNYPLAEKQLKEIPTCTNNQIELLIADVQMMRLCQRRAENKDFYDYREKAKQRFKRIAEEERSLGETLRERLNYARTEYGIINSTYFYYVGLRKKGVEAFEEINFNESFVRDTAQLLNYYYNLGAGGLVERQPRERMNQVEFDHLIRCYVLAQRGGYVFWEANSLQAMSEHLMDERDREKLIRDNRPAMQYINPDDMADSLLAGNLAQRAMMLFSKYGDVYQTAGSYRTLGECYWHLKDYKSALACFEHALSFNQAIRQSPDLVASIREQLSLVYSAMNDKPKSDYNRNIYLDIQETTRQDRELESRATLLGKSSSQLNTMIVAVVMMIIFVSLLMLLFVYLRKKNGNRQSIGELLTPLRQWKEKNDGEAVGIEERHREIVNREKVLRQETIVQKKRNVEQRAKISLVNSITPFIDQIINELNRLSERGGDEEVNRQRYEYIGELTDQINEYNEILTQWITLRKGEISLHIESFSLRPVFDVVRKNSTSFRMKNIRLVVESTDDVVKADKVLTLFMINTMADNALKWTPPGGTVTIKSRQSDDAVEISVADTGMGMDGEKVKRIFDYKPIVRESGESTGEVAYAPSGHGFGLMNCKGIIEKYKKISRIFHVCSISVKSEKGRGTVFAFRLPKGVARVLVWCALLLSPCKSMGGNHYAEKAASYADSAYQSNIRGTFYQTLSFTDSCISNLNKYYQGVSPGGTMLIKLVGDGSKEPAELQWFKKGLSLDYALVLRMRNECAVASLALHNWDLYTYNNMVYTRLFSLYSADNSLDEYVRVMQKSESNKNVAIILLAVLLVLIFPAYYFLYYRQLLSYRMSVAGINGMNDILLDDAPAEEKLRRIELSRSKNKGIVNVRYPYLASIVAQIVATLKESIRVKELQYTSLELAKDELRREKYENDRLYVSNSVLDNCLSTLKHETMYYPSRIKQLADGRERDLRAIKELASYYKELYAILSAQAMKQITPPMRVDYDMTAYLFQILRKINQQEMPSIETLREEGRYTVRRLTMNNLKLTEEETKLLFTPQTVDLQFLVCCQIIRDIGEALSARACGIQALKDNNNTLIDITLTTDVWKNLR